MKKTLRCTQTGRYGSHPNRESALCKQDIYTNPITVPPLIAMNVTSQYRHQKYPLDRFSVLAGISNPLDRFSVLAGISNLHTSTPFLPQEFVAADVSVLLSRRMLSSSVLEEEVDLRFA
jgi:hypothetical protein